MNSLTTSTRNINADFYRRQIEGVMVRKIPFVPNPFSKQKDLKPWRLLNVNRSETSVDFRFQVPSGYSVAELEKQSDALFAACGCIVEFIDHAGEVEICVYPDDLKLKIPFVPEMLRGIQPNELLLGFDRRNRRIIHNILKSPNPHLLFGGMSGFGKTDLIRLMLYVLLCCFGPSKDNIEFWVIDGKGFSFLPFEPIPNFRIVDSADLEAAAKLLEDAVIEMQNRSAAIKNREMRREDAKKLKWILVIIDEGADLSVDEQITTEDKNLAKKCLKLMGDLSRKAREPKIPLWYCAQRPAAETIPLKIRNNLGTKICFQVDSIVESQIILGPGNNAGANLGGVKGRLIYRFGGKDHIIQAPFVGDDDVWEKILSPFYPKKGVLPSGDNGEDRESLPNQEGTQVDSHGSDDLLPLDGNRADWSLVRGLPSEPKETSIRAIVGTGKKGTLRRKSPPREGSNQDISTKQTGQGSHGDWREDDYSDE